MSEGAGLLSDYPSLDANRYLSVLLRMVEGKEASTRSSECSWLRKYSSTCSCMESHSTLGMPCWLVYSWTALTRSRYSRVFSSPRT